MVTASRLWDPNHYRLTYHSYHMKAMQCGQETK